MLDEQFARLMREYDDDEIGELDETDPTLMGGSTLDAYEEVMHGFLYPYPSPSPSPSPSPAQVMDGFLNSSLYLPISPHISPYLPR